MVKQIRHRDEVITRNKTVFTTGQVAKLCKVAPRTVSKWFDSEKLKGYRIPGSQDRRIPRESLIVFLKESGMPLGSLEEEHKTGILLVGLDKLLANTLVLSLPETDMKVVEVATIFDAGFSLAESLPDVVIVDFSLGSTECRSLAIRLRELARKDYCPKLIALVGEDHNSSEPFDLIYRQPVDSAELLEAIHRVHVGA